MRSPTTTTDAEYDREEDQRDRETDLALYILHHCLRYLAHQKLIKIAQRLSLGLYVLPLSFSCQSDSNLRDSR